MHENIYAILTIVWYSIVCPKIIHTNFTRNICDLQYACHMMDHYSIQSLWEQCWWCWFSSSGGTSPTLLRPTRHNVSSRAVATGHIYLGLGITFCVFYTLSQPLRVGRVWRSRLIFAVFSLCLLILRLCHSNIQFYILRLSKIILLCWPGVCPPTQTKEIPFPSKIFTKRQLNTCFMTCTMQS